MMLRDDCAESRPIALGGSRIQRWRRFARGLESPDPLQRGFDAVAVVHGFVHVLERRIREAGAASLSDGEKQELRELLFAR